jgi:hypothetical protein
MPELYWAYKQNKAVDYFLFIYKNTTNLDKLLLKAQNDSVLTVVFNAREIHSFNARFNQNSEEKTLGPYCRKIRLVESNAKCRHQKN